ncbi:hypothetical protein GPECTOR_10g1013 [Gonium pectorale]|uniref:Uncharacterized protein n=1 Tax=Gonium pectorale TaxID=33097 RepID=A0A150GQB6_GONPE|nr:hypothetical protein GPECTOR_10g1013 [Gonium pectorale]|eukprot:KXZ51991.1 hypothetical protein GPECTOR_10g1013 [Gonium pectorale]
MVQHKNSFNTTHDPEGLDFPVDEKGYVTARPAAFRARDSSLAAKATKLSRELMYAYAPKLLYKHPDGYCVPSMHLSNPHEMWVYIGRYKAAALTSGERCWLYSNRDGEVFLRLPDSDEPLALSKEQMRVVRKVHAFMEGVVRETMRDLALAELAERVAALRAENQELKGEVRRVRSRLAIPHL